MKTYILLVTWIIYGQPPSSYQTQFGSPENCQSARLSVLGEAIRLNAEQDVYVAKVRATGAIYNPPPRQVTAVCAAQ
jgi:hypothetical protein